MTFVFILTLTACASIPSRAADIDYQSLQEDPVDTAFRRLLTQEVPDWEGVRDQDEKRVTGETADLGLKTLRWPLKTGRLAGLFNLRASRGRRRHTGVDMLAPKETPIYAVLDGVVEAISNGGNGWRGYGRVILINHGGRLWSLYAHCNSINVKIGQKVKQGEKIAGVGRTGRTTANHLHFELRNSSGAYLDPMRYLPGEGSLPSR